MKFENIPHNQSFNLSALEHYTQIKWSKKIHYCKYQKNIKVTINQ